MKLFPGAALLGALALASTACTSGTSASAAKDAATPGAPAGPAVAVTMFDMRFEPANVTLKAATPFTVTAANKGVVEHNWVAQFDTFTVQVDARPGQTIARTFIAPAPGTYRVVCTVPGHEQVGMVGSLVVE